jgi:hypothetical protein
VLQVARLGIRWRCMPAPPSTARAAGLLLGAWVDDSVGPPTACSMGKAPRGIIEHGSLCPGVCLDAGTLRAISALQGPKAPAVVCGASLRGPLYSALSKLL